MRQVCRALPLLAIIAILAGGMMFADSGGGINSSEASSHWTDYDTDGDNLIEIKTLAQLNAIRHDLNGDGIANHADYTSAFPNRKAIAPNPMGCASTNCAGYELAADLDFDENGDGQITSADAAHWNGGAGWTPIAPSPGDGYTGKFIGNGHTIANLYINAGSGIISVGLFGNVGTTSVAGEVSGVGLPNASVTSSRGAVLMGPLAGRLRGGSTITSSWATGSVTSTSAAGTGSKLLGGLAGPVRDNNTAVRASWADVTISANAAAGYVHAGGLVGRLYQGADVLASYATGAVSGGQGGNTSNGGLVGYAESSGTTINASYATGAVSTGAGASAGGLVGSTGGGSPSVTNSYWDTTTGPSASPGGGAGRSTSQLQTPEEYGAGIYANWNVNADGDTSTGAMTTGADDPWHFGASSQYPILKYGHNAYSINRQRGIIGTADYDGNDNNLIDISTLAELNAIRQDLDGDGQNTGDDALAYLTTFPRPANDMGCPDGCEGYELIADLDFDTGTAGDRTDDDYYNGGVGWTPIGVDSTGAATAFTATFDGKGHTISNLAINLTTSTTAGGGFVGLFGITSGTVRNVGIVNPNISNTRSGGGNPTTAALMGEVAQGGTVTNSYVRGGTVSLSHSTAAGVSVYGGCLVGFTYPLVTVSGSWASCAVTANNTNATSLVTVGGLIGSAGWTTGQATITQSYATGPVTFTGTGPSGRVGGLVGQAYADITSSYATGDVRVSTSGTVTGFAAGLVGQLQTNGSIKASFATGNVTATAIDNVGGLVGEANLASSGVIQAAYATGSVSRTIASNGGHVGGLVGELHTSAGRANAVQATYALGPASNADTGGDVGGLVGRSNGSVTPVSNSYWTNAQTGSAGSASSTLKKTAGELRSPTGYTGIYSAWNLDLDGMAGADDPWDFGNFCQYPALKYGGLDVSRQRAAAEDDFPDNDVTFYSGQTVTLTAVNRGGTAYLWEQIPDAAAPAVTLSDADMAQATFMAPAGLDDAVELHFKLTLLANGVCRTDLVKVTILPAQPNELSDLTVTAGGTTRPLTPAFASSGRSFDTYVGAYTGRAEITLTAADDAATISFNGDDPVAATRTETVSLAEGHNRFTITVTPPEPDPPAEGDAAPTDGDADAAEPLEPVTYHLNIRRQRTPKLAFNPPQYLLMNEGETTTYTVELDTRWLGAEVVINISSDNPGHHRIAGHGKHLPIRLERADDRGNGGEGCRRR